MKIINYVTYDYQLCLGSYKFVKEDFSVIFAIYDNISVVTL